jgi:hypothetical protein
MTGPVHTQVSGMLGDPASDCHYPWLSASSGTRPSDVGVGGSFSPVRVTVCAIAVATRPQGAPLTGLPWRATQSEPDEGSRTHERWTARSLAGAR